LTQKSIKKQENELVLRHFKSKRDENERFSAF
jgi:hypothetical protein